MARGRRSPLSPLPINHFIWDGLFPRLDFTRLIITQTIFPRYISLNGYLREKLKKGGAATTYSCYRKCLLSRCTSLLSPLLVLSHLVYTHTHSSFLLRERKKIFLERSLSRSCQDNHRCFIFFSLLLC